MKISTIRKLPTIRYNGQAPRSQMIICYKTTPQYRPPLYNGQKLTLFPKGGRYTGSTLAIITSQKQIVTPRTKRLHNPQANLTARK